MVKYIITRLRKQYLDTWSRPWPEDDKYLRELYQESKVASGFKPNAKLSKNPHAQQQVEEHTLERMRENHDF